MTSSDENLNKAINDAWDKCGDLADQITKTRIDLRNVGKSAQALGHFELFEIEANGRKIKDAAQEALRQYHEFYLEAQKYLKEMAKHEKRR